MSKPKPARYRATNWCDYNAALRKRGSLLIWLDREMAWHAPHGGRPGRPPVFSDAAPVLMGWTPPPDGIAMCHGGDVEIATEERCPWMRLP